MKVPVIFKAILWSYDFERCDPIAMKKTIIVQTLRYGTLKHWQWIRSFYGDNIIRSVLNHIHGSEIPDKTKPLIKCAFHFDDWNYAPRGVRQ
jgi:hypothetical protein